MGRPKTEDPVVQRKIGLASSVWATIDEKAKAAGLSPNHWVKDAVFAKLAGPGPVVPSAALTRAVEASAPKPAAKRAAKRAVANLATGLGASVVQDLGKNPPARVPARSRPLASVDPKTCKHPPNRRLGNQCGACLAKVR